MTSLIRSPSFIRRQVDAAQTVECSRLSVCRKPANPFHVSMLNTVKCHQMHDKSMPNKPASPEKHVVFGVWPNDVTMLTFRSIKNVFWKC